MTHWTVVPMALVAFGLVVLSPFLWLLDVATFGEAMALPWIGVAIALLWVVTIGERYAP